MAELVGIMSGTGAKAIADVGEETVTFRGAVKADVPFEEITAEARGTLLVLSFRGHTVEVSAGSRANQLAAKIRSPPSRLDRMGIAYGQTAAIAGNVDPAFKTEFAQRADLAAGVPRSPVDVLVYAADSGAALDALAKLVPLVAPGGALWVVSPTAGAPSEAQLAAAAKTNGLKVAATTRFSSTHVARKLIRP